MNISHQYSSEAGPKNSSLSDATWKNFRKYLSPYQWALDDPQCSARKSEIQHAIRHRGEKGACTFQRAYGKFVLRPLAEWAFEKAITKNRKLYYVSYGPHALLYLDVDLHRFFQCLGDGQAAIKLIDQTRLPIYWIDSSRGVNGYLKVSLGRMGFDDANLVFERLQNALRLVLADEGNLADFEVKGRCGFLADDEYSWGQYGKLPIHNPKWSWEELDKFSKTQTVPIKALEKLCNFIESRIPASVLEQHEARKKDLLLEPRIENGRILVTPEIEEQLRQRSNWLVAMNSAVERTDGSMWILEKYFEQELAVTSDPVAVESDIQPESVQPPIIGNAPVGRSIRNAKVETSDLTDEPDSFSRQRKALLRLSRVLKRVPKLAEALEYIRANDLFTGSWDDNLARRKTRIRDILKFIAQTFDASKCKKGSVIVGKYDSWAAKKFPKGLVGGRRKYVDEYGEIHEINQRIRVSQEFIAVFMAICDHTLVADKNQDGSLPHERAKTLWKSLFSKNLVPVNFCGRKWAVCREAMDSQGIITITDRKFSYQKAMKWEVGQFFPLLEKWKKEKVAGLLAPVELAEFLREKNNSRRQVHNTLLLIERSENVSEESFLTSRPPPWP